MHYFLSNTGLMPYSNMNLIKDGEICNLIGLAAAKIKAAILFLERELLASRFNHCSIEVNFRRLEKSSCDAAS
jgi:hypothetical protein